MDSKKQYNIVKKKKKTFGAKQPQLWLFILPSASLARRLDYSGSMFPHFPKKSNIFRYDHHEPDSYQDSLFSPSQ